MRARVWIAAALALAGAAPLAGQESGAAHVALGVGGASVPASAMGRCCTGMVVELRGGRWLSPGRRVDLVLGYAPGSDAGPAPPSPRPPREEGPDTVRAQRSPRRLAEATSSVFTGARVVGEVRSEHGFALRAFAGLSWWWQPQLPMGALGGGMRFGMRGWGVALELEGSAVPVPHHTVAWHYLDGRLLETRRGEGRSWAFPLAARVVVERNP